MEDGKEVVARQAFGSGFKRGLEGSVRWARLRGRVRYCHTCSCVLTSTAHWHSAFEMYLEQQGHPVREVSQLKEELESAGREGRGGEEEGERGDECSGESDVRQLWEVVENARASDKVVELEKEVETAISRNFK